MTREEQLIFCKQCTNRKMDMQHGLICSLTGARAAFQNECSEYNLDETVVLAPVDDNEGLQSSEIERKLSPAVVKQMRLEQNLMAGIMAGLIVGIFGAVLWGAVAVYTGLRIGFMATVIGVGVGLAIRKFGNGIDPIFGICGAVLSFLSVLFGDILSVIAILAESEELGYIETLFRFDYLYLPAVLIESFTIMGFVFFASAIVVGYKFSFRLITEKSIVELRKMNR